MQTGSRAMPHFPFVFSFDTTVSFHFCEVKLQYLYRETEKFLYPIFPIYRNEHQKP